MAAYTQAQLVQFRAVEDRLNQVLAKIASFSEAAWDAAAAQLGLLPQATETENLAAWFQDGVSWLNASSGDAIGGTAGDLSAEVARYSKAVAEFENDLSLVEGYTGQKGVSNFKAPTVPEYKPKTLFQEWLEQLKAFLKSIFGDIFSTFLPWIVGAVVLLFLVRQYL